MGKKGVMQLYPSQRYKLEQAIGSDFSSVRVRNGGSKAGDGGVWGFCPGDSVYFNQPDQYQRDQELPGHGLSQVVQQKTGSAIGRFKP